MTETMMPAWLEKLTREVWDEEEGAFDVARTSGLEGLVAGRSILTFPDPAEPAGEPRKAHVRHALLRQLRGHALILLAKGPDRMEEGAHAMAFYERLLAKAGGDEDAKLADLLGEPGQAAEAAP